MLEGQSFPDIYISTPLGNVYKTQSISFAATLQHTGYYKCSANTSAATDIKNHYLLVYGETLINVQHYVQLFQKISVIRFEFNLVSLNGHCSYGDNTVVLVNKRNLNCTGIIVDYHKYIMFSHLLTVR